jgi:hypothetical protein
MTSDKMGGLLNINFGKSVSYVQQKVDAPSNQTQKRIRRNRTKESNTVTYAKSEKRTPQNHQRLA